mgnify:CR=1 FL=1
MEHEILERIDRLENHFKVYKTDMIDVKDSLKEVRILLGGSSLNNNKGFIMLMESVEDAVDILKRIKSLGVNIALDDFGTGYSSLSSLTSLPLDKLKVDQSFVRRVEHDAASRAVTEAVIALGRSLKLDVHGEGIETENALQYLREHGCNQAQGFLFSKALPVDEFFLWSQNRKRQRISRS